MWKDPIVEAYKKDIDRTLVRENLKLTVEERWRKLMDLQRFHAELQRAGRQAREEERRRRAGDASAADVSNAVDAARSSEGSG